MIYRYPNNLFPSISGKDFLQNAPLHTEHQLVGRVMSKRVINKLTFVSLLNGDHTIQVMLTEQNTINYGSIIDDLSIGDIYHIAGVKELNSKGTNVLLSGTKLSLISKCLHKMPSAFHGFKDKDLRQRNRYLDLIFQPKQRQIILYRARLLRCLRSFLDERGFVEVDTPTLHPIYGGAEAEPFVTYHNSSKSKAYLRIAPELYLKRLLVGGMDKVYEIGKNFRNEGISPNHNPEFSAIEWYESYKTYLDGKIMMEQLLSKIFQLFNSCWSGSTFESVNIEDSVSHIVGSELSKERVLNFCVQHNLINSANDNFMKLSYEELVMTIFDKCVEPKLIKPTFVVGYFSSLSPLARPNDNNPFYCDRWEFFMNGMELANAYSELNDPVLQKKNMSPVDTDYITALEYAMPSAVGVGIGIERLLKVLLNIDSIRDVITYPYKAVQSK